MPAIYQTVLESKINELKETSGNRDFSQGGTTAGVTAASAIAVLQEAGNKLGRDMISEGYTVFESVCELVIELIRQFYTEERSFRITGADGMEQFVRFGNAGIAPRMMGSEFGRDAGASMPIFDLKIRAQKRSAFSTLAQNEMAKEFYAAGFFDPARAEQALSCIEMMDFEGKAQVEQRIRENSLMLQQMQMMQTQMAQMTQMLNELTGGKLGAMDGAESAKGELPQSASGSQLPPRGSLTTKKASTTEELAQSAKDRGQQMVGGARV